MSPAPPSLPRPPSRPPTEQDREELESKRLGERRLAKAKGSTDALTQ